MACSAGCPTGNHLSYGSCLRAKHLEVANPEATKHNKAQNGQLNEYVRAREAGLQPKTVFKNDVDTAWKLSDKLGSPFRADA